MPAALPADLLGALAGRFAVERELGRGGMATVLLAHDRSLDRSVAIKVLAPELSAALGPDRFNREIRLTARLVHPNIVPLFDSGQASSCLYYVMPFIDGGTLRHRLAGNGCRPVDEVVHILTDLAEALAYAHGLGIVHRDLKPENVFWYGGRALLADFGIATANSTTLAGGPLTGTGTIIGTVAYMSPEQATGAKDLDGRSDLYSLGCVAFELLTGQPPFGGDTPMALLAAHLTAPVPSVREIKPDVPPRLASVVEQLLAKEPESRPPTAAAFLQLLRTDPGLGALSPAAKAAAPARPSRAAMALAPEVHALVEKGRDLYTRAMQGGEGARDKLEMARVYCEKALALAPADPLALTTLSDIIVVFGVRGFADLDQSFDRARELRMKALAADDTVGEVHISLGANFLYWQDDFETGGIELERGVELSPDHSEGRRIYGAWLKIAGRTAEALEQMREAVRLAPRAPFMYVGLADVLMTMGRYHEAIEPLRHALRLLPRYEAALERLEMSCHRAGRHDDALDARRMMLGIRGETERMEQLAADVAADGWLVARERDLRRELTALLARAEQEDAFRDLRGSRQLADKIVIVLAELGEWSQAMDWIERGYHRRPGRLRRVLTDLPYDHHGLASDARYVRLLRAAGLEDLL
jgi:tetratricopeptide (TPR) repeat protein